MKIEFVESLPAINHVSVGRDPVREAAHREIAIALRNNPERWAKWPLPVTKNSVRVMASGINKGIHPCPKPFREGGFQAAGRNGILYIRFVGMK